MKPSVDYLLNDPIASIGNPIRNAAIDIRRRAGEPIRRVANRISKWLERRAQHRQLQRLDDHMLKDIGI